MPDGSVTIQPLPVLVPLAVALLAAAVVVLRRRGLLSAGRVIAGGLCAGYAAAVIGATFLPLPLAWGPGAGPVPFTQVLLNPFATLLDRPSDVVLNVVMTLPVAAVLRVAAGIRDRRRVVLIGFLGSLVIETTQLLLLFLHANRWTDVSDLIANTLGALLGWLALCRTPGIRRFLDRYALIAVDVGVPQFAGRN